LLLNYKTNCKEAGCDEAGRGCLAGPVFAAAVILPPDYNNPILTDSKKLSEKQRNSLRYDIENYAISWAVASNDNNAIDKLNILKASILAMHKAIDNLSIAPELLLIDGNRFLKYKNTPHVCIVGGDALYFPISAASVLAKTYRDEFMMQIHEQYPVYEWNKNKGYPTEIHRKAIEKFGISPYHRKTFRLTNTQLKINF